MKKLITMFLVLLFISSIFFVSCGTTPAFLPSIPCVEAQYHIGERMTVYGVVASTNYAAGSIGQPTFLYLGQPYPNKIFIVVIWGEDRVNFPEPPGTYYQGEIIHVTGLITENQGVPQIEVTSPSQIRVE